MSGVTYRQNARTPKAAMVHAPSKLMCAQQLPAFGNEASKIAEAEPVINCQTSQNQ